jgi:MFS family permease
MQTQRRPPGGAVRVRYTAFYMPARDSIPSGVRSLAWARTWNWVGWGFGESLIPVFIMSLAGSYAAAGIVRSAYELALLLSLPLVGILAERYPAKWLVVGAYAIYPFVGLSYYLAGVTGALVFIVIARLINGVTWGASDVGITTYFRRLTPSGSIASSFGFLDMLSEFGWILAAISAIWLVQYFSIGQLLFMVVPFSLVGLLFAMRARRDHPAMARPKRQLRLRAAYKSAIAEWHHWNTELRLLAFLLIFSQFVSAVIDFFVPIDIYQKSASLALVIVFMVVSAIPSIFGYLLGRYADKHNKPRLIAVSCGFMALVLLALTLPLPYLLVVGAGITLGLVLELLGILRRSIATLLVPETHFGRLESVFSMVGGIGDLAAPPILGALLMLMGLPTLAAVLAAIALLFALLFIARSHHRHGFPKLPDSFWKLVPPPEHKV